MNPFEDLKQITERADIPLSALLYEILARGGLFPCWQVISDELGHALLAQPSCGRHYVVEQHREYMYLFTREAHALWLANNQDFSVVFATLHKKYVPAPPPRPQMPIVPRERRLSQVEQNRLKIIQELIESGDTETAERFRIIWDLPEITTASL